MFGFFSDDNQKNRNDSIWKKNKKKNPYNEKDNESSNKIYWALFLSLVSILVATYFLLTHDFFEIKKINVSGLDKIKKNNLVSATKGIYSHKKWFFFTSSNYFLVDKKEIKNILKEKFPIRKISLKKKFPNTLNIVIQERINTIIYDNGIKYAYIGLDGKVTEIIRKVGGNEWKKLDTKPTSSEYNKKIHTPSVISLKKEYGSYPIIYDMREKRIIAEQKVMNTSTVKGALKWYRNFKKLPKLKLNYFKVATSSRNFIIYTDQSWSIKTNIENRVEEQFQKLRYVLNNKFDSNYPVKYLDLRYKNRVFWK